VSTTLNRTQIATVTALTLLYGVASLVHFAHNAEFLMEYPNLPSWLTRAEVYVVWLGVTALGVLGYVLLRAGRVVAGLLLLAAYAVLGLDGLLHYGRASVAAHTLTMNATIWFEVLAAAALLVAVGVLAARRLRPGAR